MKYLHTLTAADVGKSILRRRCPTCGAARHIHLSDVLGRVKPHDIGKRLFEVDGVIQVENDEQYRRRVGESQ